MRNLSVMVVLGLVANCGVALADCLDLHDSAGRTFEGVLVLRVFPGPPNHTDVAKGDAAESTLILVPSQELCPKADDFHDQGEVVDAVHVYATSDAVAHALDDHVGRTVRITAADAFTSHTVHHHAPIVVDAAAIADLVPGEDPERGAVEATVRSFYRALARGDGDEAVEVLVPEKRTAGPLSAKALTAFYGRLAEPLRLLDLRASRGAAEAHYTFRTKAGKVCDGRAEVTVVRRGGERLISRIKALDDC